MTSTKVLIIVLILIVVVFVVILVWGHGTNAKQLMPLSPPDHPDPQSDEKTFNSQDHPHPAFLDTFNDLFSPFSPKLQAKQLQPPITTFDLALRSNYEVVISEDMNHKFRQAKFAVRQGKACTFVIYTASPTQKDAREELKRQDSDRATDKKDPEHQFTFTILDGGGKLVVQRATSSPESCVVELK